MTTQSGNAGFFRRLIAGVIDFTILLTTSIVIGLAVNSYFDWRIAEEVKQLEKLSVEDINKRYVEVYHLPEEQFHNRSQPDILKDKYFGLESHRITNELEPFFPDVSETIWVSISHTKYQLAFPKNTDHQTIERETARFFKQYGQLLHAGNPIDRFRIAFPEFGHVDNLKLSNTLWLSFFNSGVLSFDDIFNPIDLLKTTYGSREFQDAFGTEAGEIDRKSYGFYLTALICAYIIAYLTLGVSSKFSSTFGKMALGIKVLNSDGSKLTLGKSIAYTICFLLFSIATFFTAFLPVLFNKNRQALHDRVCKVTLVCNP